MIGLRRSRCCPGRLRLTIGKRGHCITGKEARGLYVKIAKLTATVVIIRDYSEVLKMFGPSPLAALETVALSEQPTHRAHRPKEAAMRRR